MALSTAQPFDAHSGSMGRIFRRMAGIVMLSVCAITSAATRTAPAPQLDAKSQKVVDDFTRWLGRQNQLQVTMKQVTEVQGPGMQTRMEVEYELALDRPKTRFAMRLKSGVFGMTLICDGRKVYTYLPAMKRYTVDNAPPRLANLLDKKTAAGLTGMNSFPFVRLLLSDAPRDVLLAGVTKGHYVGTENIGGRPCHHLHFTQKMFDWDVWISAGAAPRLVKIVPDISRAMAKMAQRMPQMKKMTTKIAITFSDWRVNRPIPDAVFTFTPPPGAQQKDSLFPKPPKHPLVGKKAPDFTLKDLDGKSVKLSDHFGRDIVVLDFWATWCGPCRKALPLVSEATHALAGRHVVFYAVNQGEKASKIRKFLKEQQLACTVLLDSGGNAGRAYEVKGIPQTVIIGKDGVVRDVHIGFNPEVKSLLRKELEKLLSGESGSMRPRK